MFCPGCVKKQDTSEVPKILNYCRVSAATYYSLMFTQKHVNLCFLNHVNFVPVFFSDAFYHAMVRNEGELEHKSGWPESCSSALPEAPCGEIPCMDAGF
jgi:hypothetical protein